MQNVMRAKRKAGDDSMSPLLASPQSQLPVLNFAHPPTQWRFYMPAFVNNWMTCFQPRMVSRTEGAITSHQGLWLQEAMKNEALFHATLALSAAYHHKLSLEKLQFLALYHVGQAISKINLALNNESSVINDNTILAVVGIAAYENLKGDCNSSRMHLNGLQSMVTLRGGLDSLGLLARHALNWVDCSFATATAGEPLFIHQEPYTRLPSPVPGGLLDYGGSSISMQLQAVLSQLRELTQVLTSSYSTHVTSDQMWMFSHQRTLVEQELLLMRFPLEHVPNDGGDPCLRAIAEIVRLAAQIYVNLVLRCILPLSSVHRTLSAQISGSLSTLKDDIPDHQCESLEILLWSAILGGTVATDSLIREQLGSVVVKFCGQLKISSWIQCRELIENVVYSHRGCGDLCEKFYVEATSCG
ncbi:fungal-specific transcription factor domain-containing protein [Rhexocercosporidium sp. MPI-PUGE-AT-0058]|nr:fungal-specific transcription factor domain-containing protein [Rhexocercosporidium sp. MPI-PUGE-AT-0058]